VTITAIDTSVDTSNPSALDVNNDGYSDLVVGEPGANGGRGLVHLYLGGPFGLESTPSVSRTGPTGIRVGWGETVANAGDVNGDGFDDVVAGARTDGANGTFYVLYGSVSGLGVPELRDNTWEPEREGEIYFAQHVSGGGDTNGDGYADVVVTSLEHLSLYLGGPKGLASSPINLTSGFFNAVAAGDLDGDGYADVVTGGCSLALVRRGGPEGLIDGPDATWLRQDLAYHSETFQVCSGFAHAMAAADINGDGYTDIVIGAPATETRLVRDRGAIYVYLGGPAGYGTPTVVLGPLNPARYKGAQFGRAVTYAGDLDHDGYPEFAVGAPLYPVAAEYPYRPGPGHTYVFTSGPQAFSTTAIADLENPDARTNPHGGSFGVSLSAGDFDRDGNTDLAVGANTNSSSGAVYAYRANKLSRLSLSTRLTATTLNGWFGTALGGMLR
jgi:hypothetical protein